MWYCSQSTYRIAPQILQWQWLKLRANKVLTLALPFMKSSWWALFKFVQGTTSGRWLVLASCPGSVLHNFFLTTFRTVLSQHICSINNKCVTLIESKQNCSNIVREKTILTKVNNLCENSYPSNWFLDEQKAALVLDLLWIATSNGFEKLIINNQGPP